MGVARRGRRGRGGGRVATTGRRPGVRRAAADGSAERRQGCEVVVDGEAGAFEAGEALAERGDPGVGADGLGQGLVPAALRERVARPGLPDGTVEGGWWSPGAPIGGARWAAGRLSGMSVAARQTASSARSWVSSCSRSGCAQAGAVLAVSGVQVWARSVTVAAWSRTCGCGRSGRDPSRGRRRAGAGCRAATAAAHRSGVRRLLRCARLVSVVDAGVEDGGWVVGVVERRRRGRRRVSRVSGSWSSRARSARWARRVGQAGASVSPSSERVGVLVDAAPVRRGRGAVRRRW